MYRRNFGVLALEAAQASVVTDQFERREGRKRDASASRAIMLLIK